jgi:hypothetical protein
MCRRKIIGGVLGLPGTIDQGSRPTFMTDDSAYFANARSALATFLKGVQPRCVWLPSYLCRSILVPLLSDNRTHRFFPVNRNLQVLPGPWLNDVREGDVVLLIAYFGFPIEEAITCSLHTRGALILEDASQALLSGHVGRFSDYVLYSPRKIVGVPDGGILRPRTRVRDIALTSPPCDWWITTFQSCLLRRDFDLFSADPYRQWFRLFREASAKIPCGPYTISTLSDILLRTSFDYDFTAKRRRENFKLLLAALGDIALYKELPDDVVPLGFPVQVENRRIVQEALYKEDIYPPVHWDIESIVPEEYVESHLLSRHILTIVCDHRYDLEDMNRTIKCIQSALMKNK